MMFKAKKRWRLLKNITISSIDELKSVLLENRGIDIDTAQSFLDGEGELHSPFLFRDMEKAVKRIKRAIDEQEHVVIYGDYDVDGVTATAILIKTFRKLGLEPNYYIPHRFTEGYGPNKEAFQHFIDSGVDLVITVDNGITGIEEAKLLKDHGVDLIITDHHEPMDELPDAFAIIHPSVPGETYPFKELSGSGVSFKLACALLDEEVSEFIDFACLGTYADIVSVLGENRTIIKRGINRLMFTSHPGLIALRQIAKVEAINEFALGFIYGPRLNAPGRMDHAELAVELLITKDIEEALFLAEEIEALNNERKALIESTCEEAKKIIEANRFDQDSILVVHHEEWHEGILGIVASRLVDQYGKPAIVLTTSQQGYKGSARTLPDFPLFTNLEKTKDFLVTFGGHKMAAGLTVKANALDHFRQAINSLAVETIPDELIVDCKIDGSIIREEAIKIQEQFRPYGPNNECPRYLLEDVEIVEVRTVGAGGKHLRLQVRIQDKVFTCFGFGFGESSMELTENDTVDLVVELQLNTYLNNTTVQLQLIDMRSTEVQLYDYRTRYFNPNDVESLGFQPIYFNNSFDYPNAVPVHEVNEFHKHILLVDLPEKEDDLRVITSIPYLSKLLVLFRTDDWFGEELLLKREHFVKSYAVYRQFKHFAYDDPRLIRTLKRYRITKNMHKLALQVFLELKFVIIKGKHVTVVDQPEKRDLSESSTFKKMQEQIRLKEKLTLSSTKELKQFLFHTEKDDNNK